MRRFFLFFLLGIVLLSSASTASAQSRVFLVGDSITQGGQGYVSYRHELWFDLLQDGFDVDFVGQRNFTRDDPPNATWYPDYFTTFDRDHEGYWGWRTDQVEAILLAAATAAQPDFALVQLGTNDIGQNGAAGVTAADANLRTMIQHLRAVNPTVTVLLGQVPPIGPGSSYFANAAQVAPLNAAIASLASDSTTAMSPVLVVDHNSGFDLGTMMQSDGLHPNLLGEAFQADQWRATLAPLLPPGNPRPSVALTAPLGGQEFLGGTPIAIAATASDPNGSVAAVRFYEDGNLLATDTVAPYEYIWATAPLGSHSLTAEAEDDQGATTTSDGVSVLVGSVAGTPVFVENASFEVPGLADGALASGPGTFGGWQFAASANTFVGIFNPPSGSYPEAAGAATPLGADGANVAFLFNDGGPAEFVQAEQTLSENLAADTEYTLTVAIGRFLPDQPYAFSEYAGYVVQLLAGGTVVVADTNEVDPPVGEFRDAQVVLAANDFSPTLLGQPLAIRLGIADNVEDRSTHFDDVRLQRRLTPTSVEPPAAVTGLRLTAAPSPFRGQTWLQFSGARGSAALDVFDVRGRRVMSRRFEGGGGASVSFGAPPGVYFVRLQSGAGEMTLRVVSLR